MSNTFVPYSVAAVTPFTEDGDFDAEQVPPLIAHMVKTAPALLVCGSTGEQHCLSVAERSELYQLSRTAAGPSYPLYFGVAAFKTKDAVALARAAHAAGAHGIMLGFPPYRIPSQEQIEAYVRAVAAATPVPLFLYNNPRRTGFALEAGTFARLACEVPTVLGLKEAGARENVKAAQALLSETTAKAELAYFSGSDATFISSCATHGYTGLTSIMGNVYPAEMQAVSDCIQSGDAAGAAEIMGGIKVGVDLIASAGGGVLPSIKYVLRCRGVSAGYCSAPCGHVAEEQKAALNAHFGLVASGSDVA